MLFGELLENWGRIRDEYGRARIIAYLAIAGALVVITPLDTGGEPWAWRLAYWFLVIGLFDLVILPAGLRIVRRSPWMQALPLTVGIVMTPLALAIPMTAIVMLLDLLFGEVMCRLSPPLALPFSAELATACRSLGEVQTLELYGSVLAISVLAGGLLFLGTGGFKALTRPAPAQVQPGLRFLSRLPANIGTRISYLQMQDHYLRVVTRDGEAMILLPMRDAIAELDGIDGLQVHRSWWLALSEVTQIARDGRKTFAVMTDGTRIPVSETYRTALKERTEL